MKDIEINRANQKDESASISEFKRNLDMFNRTNSRRSDLKGLTDDVGHFEPRENSREHVVEVTLSENGKAIDAKECRPPKVPPSDDQIRTMKISRLVLSKIKRTIGRYPVETGGILLGDPRDFHVTEFVFDNSALRDGLNSGAVYQPDTDFLNKCIDNSCLEFIGICHSHPRGINYPSRQDERAAWSNLTSPSNEYLRAYLMPIVFSAADGPFDFFPYIVVCDSEGMGKVKVHRVELELL